MLQNNATDDMPIVSDTFKYYATNEKVLVYLNSDCIKIFNLNRIKRSEINPTTKASIIFYMRDIVGCSICKSPLQNDFKAYLTIYAYPKTSATNIKRKRTALELEYSNYDQYERNLDCVKEWSSQLNKILSRSLNDKPFLVYINPNSGSGKAKTLFLERVKPVWSEANIPHAVVITKYANHAFEHVQKLNINEIRGILVVSGDGLVYEIINGLMSRSDWKDAIKIPIGQLPGGSGNAFAASIAHIAKEAYVGLNTEMFAMHMGFLTSKYDVLPKDLVAIDISPAEDKRDTIISERIYSFLTVEWAIVADVDLESEKYRFLGGLRFMVGALKRIVNLNIYHGRVSFLPSDGHAYTPKKSLNFIQRPDINSLTETNQLNDPVGVKYLKPLNEPVPKDWVIIEENFVFFLVVYLPLIAQDFITWPDAKLDNGEMLLIFVKEGISKSQLIKLLTEGETGEYLKHDLVESVKIKAFRLEPMSKTGCLMVDGENVRYGPIQGEILDFQINCISKRIESF